MDEQSIFLEALKIDTSDERAAFVAQACDGDAPLRQDVESLLQAHSKLGDGEFLQESPLNRERTLDQRGPDLVGAQIGPYKLREQLGEGGMGVVYVAQQTEPIRRRVALKVIKPGMSSKDIVGRFEAERQTLALMDHPNVARVIDGGITDSGQPYFVMELVQGLPITEYCEELRLSTDERLQLFATVCQAVQHAHQRGVIHRDLKPSNIMVAEIDAASVPKVIDFGVAKAVDQQLINQTAYTQHSQLIGTPLYMSPEQASLGVIDIDTRSDVYSLGVLLYEILAGSTPFDGDSLKSAGFDEMRRIIREEQPPRPSAMVSTLNAQAISTVAGRRRIDTRKLSSSLSGELDWLVMKAIEKDRNRRYESASALAADIERFLNGEAVLACPPSALYRFRKFAGRYRAAITTAALLTAALIAGIVGTTWQMLRAIEAESQAVAQKERASQEAERAKSEASIAKAVNDFLQEDLLSQADPNNATEPNPNVRLRDVVDRAAAKVSDRFQEQPLVKAAIHQTLGQTYQSLGEHQVALEHFERSVALHRAELGDKHEDTLDLMNEVAAAVTYLGRWAEAEAMNRELLKVCRRELGDEHRVTFETMGNLAVGVGQQGHYAESEKLIREALEIRRRALGDEDRGTLVVMSNLVEVVNRQGRHAEAESLNREVLEIRRRVLGDEHPDTLRSRSIAADVMSDRGRVGEAERLRRDVIEVKRRVLGERHPDTISGMHAVAEAISEQGRLAEAEAMQRKVLEIQRRVLGDEHPQTVSSMHNLAYDFAKQGRFAEAETLERKAVEIKRLVLGVEHPDTLEAMARLAAFIHEQDRHAEAEQMERELLKVQRRVLGNEHPATLTTQEQLAAGLAAQGQFQEAETLQREAFEIRPRTQGDEHPNTRTARKQLANILLRWSWKLATDADQSLRDRQKAIELAREGVTLQPEWGKAWSKLGVALYSSGQWQESVEAFKKADGLIGGDHGKYSMFRAMAYWQIGDQERARELYAEAAAWIKEDRNNDQEQQRFQAEAERLILDAKDASGSHEEGDSASAAQD